MSRIASVEKVGGWAARWTVVLAVLTWSGTAAATVFHVGAGCTYSTLAAAVTAANTNPGAHTIAINSGSYAITASIAVTDANALTIEGGYASCSATTPTGQSPTLDANTKTTAGAVIAHTGAGALTLLNLRIANNDNRRPPGGLNSIAYFGGAISSSKAGALSLRNVMLDHNKAAGGAGIYIQGAGVVSRAQLTITDSLIQYNNADNNGGGIDASYTDINIGGDTEITINIAGAAGGGNGNGGGIYASNSNIVVKGHTAPGNQFLGSNSADYGGGLYLTSTDADAMSGYNVYRVTMQNDRADQPLVVDNNSANFVGGGFYLLTSSSTYELLTLVDLWNMIFTTNRALDGTGGALFIYAHNGGSNFYVSNSVTMRQSDPGVTIPPPCAAGLACNAIDSNESSSSSSYDGIVTLDQGSSGHEQANFSFQRGRMRDNAAQWALVRGNGMVTVDNSLIASNSLSSGALFAMDHDSLYVTNTTIANNPIPANQSAVYINAGELFFFHNLVDQPGDYVCTADSPVVTLAADLGITFGTMAKACNGGNVQQGDPAFVDPANADPLLRNFHLKINSEAKDRWSAGGNSFLPTFDLDGATRPYGSGATPYDFGAYEYGASVERIFADGFQSLP